MAESPVQRSLIEEILVMGTLDWVDLAYVEQIARRHLPNEDESRRVLAMGLVVILLTEGLMVPGDTRDGGFVPWEGPPSNALARIISEWRSLGSERIYPGFVAWLCNTPAGDVIGQSVLDREASSALDRP